MKNKFLPEDMVKVQGNIDIVNYRPSGEENIEQKSRKTWFNGLYVCLF